MALYRESQGSIIVAVTGLTLPTDSWATLSGGDATASSNKTRPGGMGLQEELGGQVTISDMTVTRQWSDALIVVFHDLFSAAGNTAASVTFTPLNRDKTFAGQTSFIWSGVLLSVSPPPVDSGNDAASFLSITIGLDEMLSTLQN